MGFLELPDDASDLADRNGKSRIEEHFWTMVKSLGAGCCGQVYEARAHDGFSFAVKEVSLLDQGEPRFHGLQKEISILSQLKHENIVEYYGSFADKNKLCIFLELAREGSLLNLYRTHGLLDIQVSEYTRQILNGLSYLHAQNVIHRDIKCANILVYANHNIVKLADFGLAKHSSLNDFKSSDGTAFWMAPEVVNGKHRRNNGYGLEADIWSLGCTVLEMATRQHPYPEYEWVQALYKIGEGERPPIPDYLSIDAKDFILRCLQVNPSDRPTARQLLDHPFVKWPLHTFFGSAFTGANGI